MSCGVNRRCGSDPELLWLWRRPAATAPIRPLAWEPLYAVKKKQEKKKKPTGKKLYQFVYILKDLFFGFLDTFYF